MSAATFWTPDRFRAITRGRWLHRPVSMDEPPASVDAASDIAGEEHAIELTGLSTDSRAVVQGGVFLALRGERFDGHAFVLQAARSGAALLVIDRDADSLDPPLDSPEWPDHLYILLVDDTARALTRLASAYRKTLTSTTVVAVTGSSGKTTTKQLIDTALSVTLRGTASPKSYNNSIGVPLTILSAKPTDQYLVVEVGTNAPGEIAQLASIVEPDVAVITNIGRSHLQGLGSLDAIAQEKASLLAALRPDGCALINADVPALRDHLRPVRHCIMFGRAEDADLRLTSCESRPDGVRFEVNKRTGWWIPLPGAHNAVNALAAIAVARRLGLRDEQIADGLQHVQPPSGRFERVEVGGIVVYNDAYNANPDSMQAALTTFGEVTRSLTSAHEFGDDEGRRVVVLGDMLELGDESEACHQELGLRVLELDRTAPIGHVYLFGPHSRATADTMMREWSSKRVTHLPEPSESALAQVANQLQTGDQVLIKASRLLELERLVELVAASADNASIEDVGESDSGPPVPTLRTTDSIATSKQPGS